MSLRIGIDMDGTLVDTEHLWLQAELLTMLRLGGEWTATDQQHCLGGPLERVVDYMAGKGDPEIVGRFPGVLTGIVKFRFRFKATSGGLLAFVSERFDTLGLGFDVSRDASDIQVFLVEIVVVSLCFGVLSFSFGQI